MLAKRDGQPRNKLLSLLDAEQYDLLVCNGLEPVEVDHQSSFEAPGADHGFVYFPESGVASLTARAPAHQVEVAMVGREGMIGVSAVLGAPHCLDDVVIRMPGTFSRIDGKALIQAMSEAPRIRSLLLLYVQALLTQISFNLMTTARFSVEARLARWLLMCHDRVDANELAITHQAAASVLGVRRPGVTVATHVLEGQGMIRARRGRIVVLNRPKLEALAGESYGRPEAEYDRLFAPERSCSPPEAADGTSAPDLLSSLRLEPERA